MMGRKIRISEEKVQFAWRKYNSTNITLKELADPLKITASALCQRFRRYRDNEIPVQIVDTDLERVVRSLESIAHSLTRIEYKLGIKQLPMEPLD